MKKDYSKYKWEIIIVFSILMFMIAYGQVFNLTLANDDGIPRITGGRDYIGNGRFLGVFLTNTIGYGVYNPIINSMFTYLGMLATAIAAIKLFEVKRMRTSLLMVAGVYTFPIFELYWRFGSDMWTYSIAVALSVWAIYCFTREKPKYVSGILLIVGALAIYQVMFSVLTITFSCYYIDQILRKKRDYKDAFKTLGLIAFSCITYAIIFKLLLMVTPVEITSYKGADEIGVVSIVQNLSNNIIRCYKNFTLYITANLTYFDWAHISIIWTVFNLAIVIYVLVGLSNLKSKFVDKVFVIILLVTIPLSFNSQLLVTSDYLTRTIFGALPFTLMLILIISERLGDLKYFGIGFIVVVLFFNLNTVLAVQQTDIKMMEQNEIITSSIITDLRKYPDFNANSKVAVCGSLGYNDNLNYQRDIYPFIFKYESYLNVPGPSYVIYKNYVDSFEYTYNMAHSLYQLYGQDLNLVENECDDSAPEYPKVGYIYEKNGIININYGS